MDVFSNYNVERNVEMFEHCCIFGGWMDGWWWCVCFGRALGVHQVLTNRVNTKPQHHTRTPTFII